MCVSLLATEALVEAADITVAAHRSWRAKQAGFQPGYLSYPLLGVGNTVINLLFSWSTGRYCKRVNIFYTQKHIDTQCNFLSSRQRGLADSYHQTPDRSLLNTNNQ